MSVLRNWITNSSDRPFYVRKEICLDFVPEYAWACVCGLGQYCFYINGKKVGDGVLEPAWTDYGKLIYYQKYDICSFLRKGTNILAAEVGNGWYVADQTQGYFFHFPSFMPPNPNGYKPFDAELVFSAHLEMKDKNGNVIVVDTDETWDTAQHMTVHSNCFGSEVVDGRKRIPQWNSRTILSGKEGSNGNFGEKQWTKAHFARKSKQLSEIAREQTMPPVRVVHTYKGKCIQTDGAVSVYDFGQNVSGMLEFNIKGKADVPIHIYPAEKLKEDKNVDQMAKNWIPIDVVETYIPAKDDTWEHFSMTFTYFGGRYVAIDCDCNQIRNIRLHAISSAGEKSGEFYCDDERYMQIYDLVEKAVEANMVSVHTDCPTIERFAWQEENHLMAPAIMYMKNVKKHWEKFLTDTRIAQHTSQDWFYDMDHHRYYPGDGLIPSQCPCYIPNVLPVPGMGSFYDIIGWGSSIIIGTYWYYLFYGDVSVIRSNYECGKKYFNYLKTKVNSDGFINHGLGDWGNPSGEFARENIETAFLFADAQIMKKFALILEYREDADTFDAYAQNVQKNYNEKLLVRHPETGMYGYRVWGKDSFVMTQAAQAMPLYWGMVPEDKKTDVVNGLRKILEDEGSLLSGEVGLPYIIQCMSNYDMNDLLCAFILKPDHPSYYAFVLDKETTLGEYWEKNPRSHCHDMMGHIIEWYYNGFAGIKPLEPGFKKVLIRPYIPESVNHMVCTYHSVNGDIKVCARRENGQIKLDVDADERIEVLRFAY